MWLQNLVYRLFFGEIAKATPQVKPLLTASEQRFYSVLVQAVNSKHRITPQHPVHTIVSYKYPQKHSIDYLLTDWQTWLPYAVIELDDSSHNRIDRQVRDSFVNQKLRGAGLRVIRQPVRRAYDVRALRLAIYA